MLKIKNPYPGFANGLYKPYEFIESDYFFGRERDLNNIKLRLRQNNFVSILSSSSGGKTSFLKAGIIADLKSKIYPGEKGNFWRPIYLNIGPDPFISLARAIVNPQSFQSQKIKPSLEEEVLKKLQKNDYGLIRVIEDLGKKIPLNILIIIDDFSGLFSPNIEEKKQAKFVSLLMKALQAKDLGFYLITSMNVEDFQNVYLKAFKEFYRRMELGTYNLRLLDQKSLRDAIETPARIEKSEIHADLSLQLIEELIADYDQLRKLQLYLNRSWFEWKKSHKDKYVTVQHYKKATGNHKAVISSKGTKARTAAQSKVNIVDTGDPILNMYEAEYAHLTPVQQPQFKKLLQCLMVLDNKDNIEFKRVEFKDITRMLGLSDGEVIKIMNQVPSIIKVDRKFLQVSKQDSINNWDRALAWIKTERENISFYKTLADASILHYIDGIDIESVFSKTQYEKTKIWYDDFKPSEAWGKLYHDQYDLAKDLIEKLEEFYGPVKKSGAKSKASGKIVIGGKQKHSTSIAPEDAEEAKTETEVSNLSEEDEDAAIAALLAKGADTPIKEDAKIQDSKPTAKPIKKIVKKVIEPEKEDIIPAVENHEKKEVKKVVLKKKDGGGERKKIVLKKKT